MPATRFAWPTNEHGYRLYRAKAGANYNDEIAQAIGERMEDMEREGIPATSENIVTIEHANPESPFYPLFDHDIRKAANRWWIQQARHIINHLEVVRVRIEDEEPEMLPAFVSVVVPGKEEAPSQRQYVSIARVMEDKDLRKQALDGALRDMRIFRRKYAQLNELSEVFEAMESTIQQLTLDDTKAEAA